MIIRMYYTSCEDVVVEFEGGVRQERVNAALQAVAFFRGRQFFYSHKGNKLWMFFRNE